MLYGSEEDESDAQVFLSAVNKDDTQLKDIVISHFKRKFENLPEVCRLRFTWPLYFCDLASCTESRT